MHARGVEGEKIDDDDDEYTRICSCICICMLHTLLNRAVRVCGGPCLTKGWLAGCRYSGMEVSVLLHLLCPVLLQARPSRGGLTLQPALAPRHKPFQGQSSPSTASKAPHQQPCPPQNTQQGEMENHSLASPRDFHYSTYPCRHGTSCIWLLATHAQSPGHTPPWNAFFPSPGPPHALSKGVRGRACVFLVCVSSTCIRSDRPPAVTATVTSTVGRGPVQLASSESAPEPSEREKKADHTTHGLL